MDNQPRYVTSSTSLGNLNLELTGEQYKGSPILDTKVCINEETLCWITWEDKDRFIQELRSVVDKYSI